MNKCQILIVDEWLEANIYLADVMFLSLIVLELELFKATKIKQVKAQ
jgi:hypothetical protein